MKIANLAAVVVALTLASLAGRAALRTSNSAGDPPRICGENPTMTVIMDATPVVVHGAGDTCAEALSDARSKLKGKLEALLDVKCDNCDNGEKCKLQINTSSMTESAQTTPTQFRNGTTGCAARISFTGLFSWGCAPCPQLPD